MDNYEISRNRARDYFLTKDLKTLIHRPGVRREGESLVFPFLGCETQVNLNTGVVTCSREGKTWEADFSESLSVYDWLCDAKPDAVPSGIYCPVNSLPGILVGGSGTLNIGDKNLSSLADQNPEKFTSACLSLGAETYPTGDLGFLVKVFPDLMLVLKFYRSDEDFPPQLTVLWDQNTLHFVRYETVYYIAGVLFRRLKSLMI